jgi:hypothetical protein
VADIVVGKCGVLAPWKRRHFRDPFVWVVSMDIQADQIVDCIDEAVALSMKFDHFVSVNSAVATGIVEIPEYAIACIRRWKAPVCFSFTVID